MDNQKILIENSIKHLIWEGATYASISIARENKIILFKSSNNNWNEKFYDENYLEHCHLIKAAKKLAKKNTNFTLFWDLAEPDSDISCQINDLRLSYNMCHGVSACFTVEKSSYFIAIASDHNNKSFPEMVINNKHKIFEELKKITSFK